MPRPRTDFTRKLLIWHRERNQRQMPWKGEKEPYRVWLSEIILQQTRVEQGRAYYESFVKKYPNIHGLANAPDKQVFKLWEGLGYYSRCRNLLHTARQISREFEGKFPDNYKDLLRLKGVGPYTAAAIASFAFDLPHAVVDGNVSRVLSRYFGISTPVNSPEGKKRIGALAAELIHKKDPAAFNQAIMDFGATVCKPVSPSCGTCVLRTACDAHAKGAVNLLPVKERSTVPRHRWFYYLVCRHRNKLAVRQRNSADIWRGLFEFPFVENPAELTDRKAVSFFAKARWIPAGHPVTRVHFSKQQLTHQLIHARFFLTELPENATIPEGFSWMSKKLTNELAFPKIIREYLDEFDPHRAKAGQNFAIEPKKI